MDLIASSNERSTGWSVSNPQPKVRHRNESNGFIKGAIDRVVCQQTTSHRFVNRAMLDSAVCQQSGS